MRKTLKIRIRFAGKTQDAKYYLLSEKRNITKTELLELSVDKKIFFQLNPNSKKNKSHVFKFNRKKGFLRMEINKHKKGV